MDRCPKTEFDRDVHLDQSGCPTAFDELEIDFAPKGINARHLDAHIVSEAKLPPMALALNDVLLFVVVVIVIDERREFDQAFDKKRVKLDEKPEGLQAGDESAECFADFSDHELRFLEIDYFALGIHRHALTLRCVAAG